MSAARGRARIALPLAACWEKLRDLERARHYVPGVSALELTTEAREGVGASRRVTATAGTLDETVVEWQEGASFRLRLHRGDDPPPFFAEASFRYALEPTADSIDACEIFTEMRYVPRGGAFGLVLDWLLLRWIVGRSVRDVAVSLAHHYETDEPVPPGLLRELRRKALPT